MEQMKRSKIAIIGLSILSSCLLATTIGFTVNYAMTKDNEDNYVEVRTVDYCISRVEGRYARNDYDIKKDSSTRVFFEKEKRKFKTEYYHYAEFREETITYMVKECYGSVTYFNGDVYRYDTMPKK